MIPIAIADREYLMEFKHRKRRGKWPELYGGSAINGITTCVIFGDNGGEPFVAIGTSICVREDGFNRRFGRKQSFMDAVLKCGLLRPHAVELGAAFARVFPEPAPPAPKPKVKLTAEQKAELRAKASGKAQRRRHDAAKDSIAALFNDQSVDRDNTRALLSDLRNNIDLLLGNSTKEGRL